MIPTEKLLTVAKEAAMAAGEVQLSFIGKKKEIDFKANEFDLVTNADKLCEEKIINVLKGHFPEHSLLGEESGAHVNNLSAYEWVIDPIDGTTNFAHNFPHFAVSIGLKYKNKLFLGVVFDACKNEMFWAAEGVGAYLNAEPIQVSKADSLKTSLLATGFPFDRSGIMEKNLKYFTKFIYEAQAIRRPGSASLDLCYVACGRVDGFWELNLAPWDTAAGALIVEQAGGKVTNIESKDFDIHIKSVLATNGLLHESMTKVIKSCKDE